MHPVSVKLNPLPRNIVLYLSLLRCLVHHQYHSRFFIPCQKLHHILLILFIIHWQALQGSWSHGPENISKVHSERKALCLFCACMLEVLPILLHLTRVWSVPWYSIVSTTTINPFSFHCCVTD